VIVGGTGLYFKALLEGLSPVPEIPEAIRRYWRAQAATADSRALHAALAERDPAIAARIAHTDPQRIVRALEVLDATGQSLLDWQKTAGSPLTEADETERLFVCLPRDILYARCDARLDQMVAGDALDEVKELASLRLDAGLPAMRALGVRPFLRYLNGLLAWEAAVDAAKTETRRYAKRQMTWARSHMISWKPVPTQ
jgi:tRNA dimethylallyltransferase